MLFSTRSRSANCNMEVPSLRSFILNAASAVRVEFQRDNQVRLELPSHPPLARNFTRPFSRALCRYLPEIRVEEWDADPSDAERQPTAYSMQTALLPKYIHWARCLGVSEETLGLPKWLTPILEESEHGVSEEPDFFSEPQAGQLMDYQREGIRFGVRRGGRVLLADEMGLGKTLQALGIAWQYRASFPLLVICPTSLQKVWQRQVARWLKIPVLDIVIPFYSGTRYSPPKVVIVSYAALQDMEQIYGVNAMLYKVVILDECLKNTDAQSSVLIRYASWAERLILISGAPSLLSHTMDLYPLLHILDAKIGNKEAFVERYFGTGPVTTCGTRRFAIREQELHQYFFKTIGLRRSKCDVLGTAGPTGTVLPAKRRQPIVLLLSSRKLRQPSRRESLELKQMKQMEGKCFAKKSRIDEDERRSQMKVLSQMVMQMKKRCCADYVREILSNGSGKLLLYAYHRQMLDSLESMLEETVGIDSYVRIDANTPDDQKSDLVTQFSEDVKCLVALLSFTALSGETLRGAEAIVFAELAWAPGIILQCEDRAHLGQKKGSLLIQYLLLDECEWDTRCYERLEEKQQFVNKSLDNPLPLWQEELRPEVDDRQTPSSCHTKHPKRSKSPSLSPSPPRSHQRHSKSSNCSVESYQVVELLHLGLNLKINQCYTKEALERKCKGDQRKLTRLHFFMEEGKKLQKVSGCETRAHVVQPAKRQKQLAPPAEWVKSFLEETEEKRSIESDVAKFKPLQ